MNKKLFLLVAGLILASTVKSFATERTEGWMDSDLCLALRGFIQNDSACRFPQAMTEAQRQELRRSLIEKREGVLKSALCKISQEGTQDLYVVSTGTDSLGVYAVAKDLANPRLNAGEVVHMNLGFFIDGAKARFYYGYASLINKKGEVIVDNNNRTLVLPLVADERGECATR